MSSSYIEGDLANKWCLERGLTGFAAIADNEKPKLLLRASEWIDQNFQFTGKRLSSSQIRAWPRDQAIDTDGTTIIGIPDVVIAAVIELCLLLAEDPEAAEQAMGIAPSVTHQKAGGIEIRYESHQNGKTGKIAQMLAPVLRRHRDIRIERG